MTFKSVIFCLSILLLFSASVFAQSATVTYEGMPYSFIAKDANGQRLVSLPNVAVNLKVRDVFPGGTVVYEENITTSIPVDGVVTGILGQGIPVTSNRFNTVDFGDGQDKFLEITLQGTSQGVVQLYAPQVELNSKVKTITQANHQSIILNDGDWVTVEGMITLSSTYNRSYARDGYSIFNRLSSLKAALLAAR